jgi:7-cyano-7-deazaguanine synthase
MKTLRKNAQESPEVVVLLSGGIDSTTLLFQVARRHGARNVHAISFMYGQRHAKELLCAQRQARAAGARVHRVIRVPDFPKLTRGGSALTDFSIPVPRLNDLGRKDRRQPPTYVPNRNMILLSLAAAYAESNGIRDIYYGAHREDSYGYWDCTPAFLRGLNRTLALNRRTPVRIRAPFMNKTKSGIVLIGRRLGVDYSKTWSCYAGGKRHCGVCPTCVERSRALTSD